ncbi:PREDICTED: vanin-like protein 2 isoform X2 [Papilio polytes]|uniref:vanin-like protein 2 isoform X2 n=1 Tax=Papilio polytes TaxID=76194 RepID=UPI000675BE46|nr:PREDICTED: vanin-like protein 2 isoform X2 [Papilio polytes]
MRLFVSTLFLCLVFYSEQKSTPQDDSYVAAVVEYEVNTNVSTNLQNYVNLIKEAAEQNADIIVFPEMTLTRGQRRILVPVHGILKTTPIPALNPELYDEILVSISAAAREHLIYVVINVQEVMDCSNAPGEYCPEQKEYLFNTNVVFDRNGAVIDRYRKINLFGEFTRTPALKPELGIFSTDFGVTFGHYICFDLMFQVPAVQVVQKHNLTDVIFSTMWFSEMPYLTAVEIQEAYTYAMNVNFLASGANNVRVGSAGSGIYSGKAGALISVMPGVPTTRLLVAKVPKVPGQVKEDYPGPISDDPKALDSLRLISDPSLPSHSSRELVSGSQEFTLTTNEVSCKFSVNLQLKDGGQHYRYRAAAFTGVRSFSGMATGGNRICSVLACIGDTIETCGRRFPNYQENATAIFEELSIIASMPTPQKVKELDADDSVFYPVSLDVAINPLRPEQYTYEKTLSDDGHKTHYSFKLNNVTRNLYSFAVWGRVFADDGKDATPPLTGGSLSIRVSAVCLLVMSIFYAIA